ncbi:hypothetical protein RUM43_004883 [Polyplax serrata]|uniref:Uncharacterized protein n=1 Tax=Polyplax serrata TaxID=468196 RepID=A0AAN8SBB4_POLSC
MTEPAKHGAFHLEKVSEFLLNLFQQIVVNSSEGDIFEKFEQSKKMEFAVEGVEMEKSSRTDHHMYEYTAVRMLPEERYLSGFSPLKEELLRVATS